MLPLTIQICNFIVTQTRKAERSFMQKYNRLQLMLLKGQLVLTEIVTMCEKIKNIFIWYHHRKTK